METFAVKNATYRHREIVGEILGKIKFCGQEKKRKVLWADINNNIHVHFRVKS